MCGAGAGKRGQHIAAVRARAAGTSQLLAAGLGHAHALDVDPFPCSRLPVYADVEASGSVSCKPLAHQHACSAPCVPTAPCRYRWPSATRTFVGQLERTVRPSPTQFTHYILRHVPSQRAFNAMYHHSMPLTRNRL